jgi:hypothetical protein
MELTQEQKDAIFKLALDLSVWRTRQKKANVAVAEAEDAHKGVEADLDDLERLFPKDEGSPTWAEGVLALIQG